MKYIVLADEDGENEMIFAFPKMINHDAFAEALECFRTQTSGKWERIYRTPVSAGFIDKNWRCYGRSETLGLDSREVDTELLLQQRI